eukprot:CAMPEP_0179228132 /NCGR_PEP_ID=MMETSP0797-20121207/9670_1 /TAXON_ID=47934 /ORGANISM="Dinophysis acuminata, Strain DAEP01" /LENGTH=113 /DNA_ID=CAMNT_0020935179 /DNA_START=45 /DNA_END=386 /DNA_ORIENTATION=+
MAPPPVQQPAALAGTGRWMVLDGKKLVVSDDILENHPGGSEIIFSMLGRDCTQEFMASGHSKSAYRWAMSHAASENNLPEPVKPSTTTDNVALTLTLFSVSCITTAWLLKNLR